MKKVPFLIAALVVAAVAILVAVAVDGNQAAAYPGGFDSGCQACHGPQMTLFPHANHTLTPCDSCHTGGTGVGTADINKCANCHGGANTIAAQHGPMCTSCHGASTTTLPPTTTTEPPGTTSTTAPPGTTSTTGPPVTTSTTTAPATTTTIPGGEPEFTG